MTLPIRLTSPNRPALLAGLAAAALAAAVLPATAATQSYSYRVELAASATQAQVRAGGVNWECRGKFCIASARGGNVTVRGCRELASQVGRVVSYRSEIKQLGGEDIDACNVAVGFKASTPQGEPTPTAAPTPAAKQPESRSSVTTEELTFTGVHKWSPAK